MKEREKNGVFRLGNWNALKGFRGLLLFVVINTLFHFLYKHFEADIISINFISVIIVFLTGNLLISTNWILEHVFAVHSVIEGDMLILPNGFSIEMQSGCSGLQQLVLLILLFLIYPGQWRHKLWFIPVSLIGLHLLNFIRFTGMSLYSAFYPAHFHVVHDWIFRPFIYLGIFLLWVVWTERINKKPGPTS